MVVEILHAHVREAHERDLEPREVHGSVGGGCGWWREFAGYETQWEGLVAGYDAGVGDAGGHFDRWGRLRWAFLLLLLLLLLLLGFVCFTTTVATTATTSDPEERRPLLTQMWGSERRGARLERKGPARKGLLRRRRGARRLNGQELEADLVAPVLLEESGPLDRYLDVIPDLGLGGEAGQRRR